MLYCTLYRFTQEPRAPLALLVPLGLSRLALALRLMTKGFREPDGSPAA